MPLVQISENLLFDFVAALKEVAPLRKPENDEELELIRKWAEIANYAKEVCRPVSHVPGFDADIIYWTELEESYRQEVRDYLAQHLTRGD